MGAPEGVRGVDRGEDKGTDFTGNKDREGEMVRDNIKFRLWVLIKDKCRDRDMDRGIVMGGCLECRGVVRVWSYRLHHSQA